MFSLSDPFISSISTSSSHHRDRTYTSESKPDFAIGSNRNRFSSCGVCNALTASEKIGGSVLDVTKVVSEAFAAQKDLLVRKPNMARLAGFLKPLSDVTMKSDSLSALAWIAFTGKDCGKPDGAPAKGPPGAPAPPPAPSASLFSSESSKPSSSSNQKQGMSAVFQPLSTGSVTSGLRKVIDDMKTKNRTDRSERWVVENQIGKKDLVISECDSTQSVYVFGCKDYVLQIQGKVNNITIDKCTKVGVVFSDVVAAFEIVNCTNVEVQCQVCSPFYFSI
ncbi:unnamed protein product [Cochlearia groenlandica]